MKPYLELLRVKHWIKNAAVLIALPFVWLAQGGWHEVLHIALAFASFCLASSACYVFNDLIDRQDDLLHPHKKHRPLARGDARIGPARVWALILLTAAVVVGWNIPYPRFMLALAGYVTLMCAYSLMLKYEPILDVIAIACGFVIRTVAGAVAVDIYISPWLVVCTFTLCMFLGFGKRRSEIYAIDNNDDAIQHRRTLTHYSADLLNQLLSTSAGIALIAYMLYITETEPLPGQTIMFDKKPLLYTLPLVAYGLFRYAMLIEHSKAAGPVEIILKDKLLWVTIGLWMIASLVIVLLEPLSEILLL